MTSTVARRMKISSNIKLAEILLITSVTISTISLSNDIPVSKDKERHDMASCDAMLEHALYDTAQVLHSTVGPSF